MNPRCNDCTFDGECNRTRDDNACLHKRPCALERKPSLDPEDKICGNCQCANWHSGGRYSCSLAFIPSDSSKWNQSDTHCIATREDGSLSFQVKTTKSEEENHIMSKEFMVRWYCHSCERKDNCQIYLT